MKAIFCVPFAIGRGPVLPPMSSDGGLQLHYDDKGTLRGGYSCIGYVGNRKTCLVLVEASPMTIDAIAASASYLHVTDDGAASPVAVKNTESWLLSQGHDAKELEKVDFVDKEKALREVLKVTAEEYAGGVSVMAPASVESVPIEREVRVI